MQDKVLKTHVALISLLIFYSHNKFFLGGVNMSTILDKIVNKNHMPVLFVGSGISKRYLLNYPDWSQLLESSFHKYNNDDFQFQKYIDKFKRDGLTDFEINTELGSIIENQFNEAFFDHKFTLKIGNTKNPSWVKRGISPYKMYLSHIFKNLPLNTKQKKLNEELLLLKSLKTKISAVITTNYDQFLEKEVFESDFTVFAHQNELFSADSYNSAEIYKIHGCCTDANSIIITKQDYSNFNSSRKLIIAKMLTLFAESPIIFLGYSFTDENIQNIVLDFLSCLSPKDIENIHEHFVFITYKPKERKLIEIQRTITTKTGEQIPITEIQTDNFLSVYNTINRIVPGVSPKKIRDTKRIVKTIVDQATSSSAAESIIVGIEALDNIDLSNKPLAVAVGYKTTILSTYGYALMSAESIFEDILYNNQQLSSESMCQDRFKSIPINKLLPVHKYVKQALDLGYKIDENSMLNRYIKSHNSIELIIGTSTEKALKNVPILTNYNDLLKEFDSVKGLNKVAGIVLKNIAILSNTELRLLCQDMWQKYRSEFYTSTNFKRCVMCLDFRENGIKND